MRTVSSLVLLASLLFLAASARAQTPLVADPYDPAGCGQTDYVGVELGDPNGAYAGLFDCHGLCRLAEAECRKLSRFTFSCQSLILAKRATWSKENCRETITNDPAALRQCRLAVKSQAASDLAAVRSALQTALGNCGSWSTECQATCITP